MARPPLPDDIIQKIINLRRNGYSVADISKELNICRSSVTKYIGLYQPSSVKGGPPTGKPGQVLDKTDYDGTVEVLTMEKPLSEEKVRSLCNLDKKWIAQWAKPNIWQGFYKLKNYLPDSVLNTIIKMSRDGATLSEVKSTIDASNVGHRKVNLVQTKYSFKRIITEDIENAIVEFTNDNVTPLPKGSFKKRREKSKKGPGFALSWGLWDAHIGLYAWQREVGADFDIDIACNRIFNSVDDMIIELEPYNIDTIWMPIGNDFTHFDSVRNTTALGDHQLDIDTRYARVFESALMCLCYMVERGLEICNKIDCMYVPGNHDYTSSFCLVQALRQRYRNDPRVTVDAGPDPEKYRMYGGTLLGFHHGKGIPPNQWNNIFSTKAKDVWSDTTYREIQIGHTHQKKAVNFESLLPTNGLLVRTHPALCNSDYWHHSKGLIGEPVKSVESWRYDKVGCRGSHITYVRDGENDKVDIDKILDN